MPIGGQFNLRKTELLKLLKVKGTSQYTNAELGEVLNVSERQVQNYINALVDDGEILINNRRFKHPNFGWCNTRTISIRDWKTQPHVEQTKRQVRMKSTARQKISDEDVSAIRSAWWNGTSQSALARQYGVAQPTIWAIVHNKTRRL